MSKAQLDVVQDDGGNKKSHFQGPPMWPCRGCSQSPASAFAFQVSVSEPHSAKIVTSSVCSRHVLRLQSLTATTIMADEESIIKYGYTPVPRDPDVLFKDHPTASGDHPKQDPVIFSDFALPDSPLVQQVREFVKVKTHRNRQVTFHVMQILAFQEKLNDRTFNHSNRVYIYGQSILSSVSPARC